MFRYSILIDSLIKAITHKYIRRVPKGITKTGATKYMYYYAGQEGHGKGVAHEEELVVGASFAFGEHGKTRYHAHISKVDGDKITVKYDDGDKKDTSETMTKKQFQAMIHGEHKEAIKQAQTKAEKQLKDFQAGKEKGVKVKQSTLDKLESQVNKLKAINEDKQEPDNQRSTMTQEQLHTFVLDSLLSSGAVTQRTENNPIIKWIPGEMKDLIKIISEIVRMSQGTDETKPFTIDTDTIADAILKHKELLGHWFDMPYIVPRVYNRYDNEIEANETVTLFGATRTNKGDKYRLKSDRTRFSYADGNDVASFYKDRRSVEFFTYEGVFKDVGKLLSSKDYIKSLINDAISDLQKGENAEKRMSTRLTTDISNMVEKKIQEAKDFTSTTNIYPQEGNLEDQSGHAVFKKFQDIIAASVQTGRTKPKDIETQVAFVPSKKALLMSHSDRDWQITVMVKNPANISSESTPGTEGPKSVILDPKSIKTLLRTKQKEITISEKHGPPSNNQQAIERVIDNLSNPQLPSRKVTIPFDDAFKEIMSKIPGKQPPSDIDETIYFERSKDNENMVAIRYKQYNRIKWATMSDTIIGQVPVNGDIQDLGSAPIHPQHLRLFLPIMKDMTMYHMSRQTFYQGHTDNVCAVVKRS